MTKPRLLDLFCGAGGAARGYQRAGFYVIGIDIEPQPNYCGDQFHQADAMLVDFKLLQEGFAAIHASPPCQDHTRLRALQGGKRYPRLIEPTRKRLQASGLPWVIENVEGAPLINPIRLCGSSFGLGVRRHRLFELSHPVAWWPQCEHDLQPAPIDVTGTGGPFNGARKSPGGGVSRKPRNVAHAREVMGIDWMTRPELSEAIPPAYTEWIGRELLQVLASVPAPRRDPR